MVGDDELRCPATGARLHREGSVLRTEDGARRYPIVDGVPILIADERSLFAHALTSAQPAPQRSRAARAVRRLAGRAAERLRQRRHRAAGRPPARAAARVVAAAARARRRRRDARRGHGAAARPPGRRRHRDRRLARPSERGWCATGTTCRSRDGTFDAVVCQAVLEHVLDPPRVVAEMHRVLRPAGLLYAEIPFMQQVHEGAYDFTRYTYVGQRRLFRRFRRAGEQPGLRPGDGARVVGALPRRDAGRARPRGRARVISHLVPLATFWLPRLDRWLIGRPGAMDAASSIGFLGRRREDPARRRRDRRLLPRAQRDAEPLVSDASARHGTPERRRTRAGSRRPTPRAWWRTRPAARPRRPPERNARRAR